VADGGDGTLDVLFASRRKDAVVTRHWVTGPLGAPVRARLGRLAPDSAVVEVAEASGLRRLPRRSGQRCSGPGSLEIIIGSDGSTATHESSEVPGIGSGGEAKPGVPISLVIKVEPVTTGEIVVYAVNVELRQP
jgi:Glycerate kinase family